MEKGKRAVKPIEAIRRYFSALERASAAPSVLGRQLDLLELQAPLPGNGRSCGLRALAELDRMVALGDAALAVRGLTTVEKAVLWRKYWSRVLVTTIVRRHPATGGTVDYEIRQYPSDESCADALGLRPQDFTVIKKTALRKVSDAIERVAAATAESRAGRAAAVAGRR